MSDVKQEPINLVKVEQENTLDFEVLETNEASALEEMGASSTIDAGSTCSKQTISF